MNPRKSLQDNIKQTWCGGGCRSGYLPSPTEILQGLVNQNADGSLSLRTTSEGGGVDSNINVDQVGGNAVSDGLPVVNPGGQGMVGGGLVPEQYTQVVQTIPAPSAEVEEYVYTLTGGGTATVTITYSDANKDTLVSAVRS